MDFLKLALVALPFAGATLTLTPAVMAQDAEEEAAPEEGAESSGGESDDDGVRFRGGISGGGGGLFVEGLSLGLGGLDGRMGVQINDLIGVYAQPQLAIYGGTFSLGGGSASSVGGIIGGTAVADVTFIDQIFVGAGGGGGMVNSSSFAGGILHIRAGGYPLMGFGEDGIRRKGLMLSADLRLYFAGGATFISPMASIGYEAF
jgi:hypothetical protein